MDFDELFDNSVLPSILQMAKTLSKEECRPIYNYFKENMPKTIMEFGTQYGCSTRVFLEISKWLNLDIKLHSWDIIDSVKSNCVDKNNFVFHIEDVTGKEDEIIKKYDPDVVFLDAHPYQLTKGLMETCLRDKIDFFCHDVGVNIYERAKIRSKGFTNKSPSTMTEWELPLLMELISNDILHQDFYENDNLSVRCVRDRYGIAIVGHKK